MRKTRLRNPALMMPETLQPHPITPLNYCTSVKGLFDDTNRYDMSQAMSEYRRAADTKSLLLFFHGGIVAKEHGMDGARRLYGPWSATAPPTKPDADLTAETWGNAYPYFFVWESGLFETLQHNLPGIVGDAIFLRIRDIVGGKAEAVLKPGTARAASDAMLLRTPTLGVSPTAGPGPSVTHDDILEVQRAVEDDPIINAEKRRIAQSHRSVRQALTESLSLPTRTVTTAAVSYLSPEIVSAIVAEDAQREHAALKKLDAFWNPIAFGTLALGAGHVLARIVQRFAQGRNHNFHNTVVEEIFRQFYLANIGASVWAEMKLETQESFGVDPNCVGTAMIQELINLYETGENGLRARVTLIGHSTGAVYICNFLEAMAAALRGKAYAERVQFDVIFMAAAVRADIFADTIAAHGRLVRNFRAFEMSDELESTEILVQLDNPPNGTINAVLAQIYTSSLLYFIAGVLEENDDDTPLVGMERYFTGKSPFVRGSFASIDTVAKFLARYPKGIVRSDTSQEPTSPALGMRCGSRHHGGFPSDNANGKGGTLESVCYLIRTGTY